MLTLKYSGKARIQLLTSTSTSF